MSGRHSEEILLQIPHVRHKKNDGTLYLMGERCGWMMKSKDSFNVQVKYADVKSQKISAEGKPKIQLQLVMHDDSIPAVSFHFSHPDGPVKQLQDREAVKEMLSKLLPKFKRKINKELEEKNRLLSENPGLLQLYKDLVITQIQTAEEFWAQHGGSIKSKNKQHSVKQSVGVSGSFLAEIKPQADGANGLKYNLTADIIEAIFKTYPAVKRKHEEHVLKTGKMSEQEFWTKFFQSHYFHRDRIHGQGVKDIFTECAKDDDRSIREQLKAGVADKVANVTAFSDKTLDENYGGFDGQVPTTGGVGIGGGKSAAAAAAAAAATSASAAASVVSQNIIKRFNQHSIMVMRTSANVPPTKASENGNSSSASSSSSSSSVVNGGQRHKEQQLVNQEETGGIDDAVKMKRLRDQLTYNDLEAEPPKKTSKLNLKKVERYLAGPTIAGSSAANSAAAVQIPDFVTTLDEINKSRAGFQQELQTWQHGHKEVLKANHAVTALVDLSPGGSLMQKSARQDALVAQCPSAVKQQLAALYTSLGELARHFWSCFPAATAERAEKVVKMHETLRRFQQVKLKPFENELARNYTSIAGELTAHINQMLEAAFRKFVLWKQNKQKRPPMMMMPPSPASRTPQKANNSVAR